MDCEGCGVSTISSSASFALFLGDFGCDVICHLQESLVNPATLWALSIQSKLSKIWKQRQMGQKFPRKVSRNSRNSWISEMRTIQPKILEILGAKLNGKKTSGKSFRKLGYTSRDCPALFGNLGKCCSTRYWKLPKFKSYFLVEMKAPFNFFCILSLQQLTETEKKIEAR